jgi:hypothetical protein
MIKILESPITFVNFGTGKKERLLVYKNKISGRLRSVRCKTPGLKTVYCQLSGAMATTESFMFAWSPG